MKVISSMYRTRAENLHLRWTHNNENFHWLTINSYYVACAYKHKPTERWVFVISDCLAFKLSHYRSEKSYKTAKKARRAVIEYLENKNVFSKGD